MMFNHFTENYQHFWREQNLFDNMLEEGFTTIVLPTLSTMILFIITLNLFRYLVGKPCIHIRDVTKEHNWKSITRENKVCIYVYVSSNILFIIFSD